MADSEQVKRRLQVMLDEYDERDKPVFFAGRKAVIDTVSRTVDTLRTKKLMGRTFVLQGAPGAGKTALLGRIEEVFGKDHCVWRKKVPDDSSTFDLWNDLAGKLTGLSESRIQGTKHVEAHGGAQGGVLGILRGEGGYRKGTTVIPHPITSCAQIEKLARGRKIPHPVIVMIDEIQGIKPDSEMANFVADLHTQSEMPLLLICAGLSDSVEKLQDVGISRSTMSNRFPVGQLSVEESVEGVRGALKAMEEEGVAGLGAVAERLSVEIARRSDAWPHHMTGYVRGVLDTLISKKGRPDFSDMDWNRAFSYGDAFREAYYEERMASSRLPVSVIAKLYRRIRKGPLSRIQCAAFMRDQIDMLGDSERSIVEMEIPDGIAALNAATHSGIISLGRHEVCEIPIPSMADYVFERELRELGGAGSSGGMGGSAR